LNFLAALPEIEMIGRVRADVAGDRADRPR